MTRPTPTTHPPGPAAMAPRRPPAGGRAGRARRRAGVLVAVLAVALLGACSRADDSSTADRAPAALDDGVAADVATEAGGAAQVPDAVTRRRIRTAQVRLAVPGPGAVATTADAVAELATSLDGLVDGDDRTAGDDARAVLVVRVPPDELETAVERLGELGEVRSTTIDTDDVTAEYTDLEGRIATLEASVERLRALIAEADDVVQIAALESELTDREAQLESAAGQLRVLGEQTDLATLTVTIAAVDATIEDEAPSPADALGNGWRAFVATVVWTVAIVAAALPFLVTLALVALGVRWALRRRRARRPDRPTPPGPSGPAGGDEPSPRPPPPPAADDPGRPDATDGHDDVAVPEPAGR